MIGFPQLKHLIIFLSLEMVTPPLLLQYEVTEFLVIPYKFIIFK